MEGKVSPAAAAAAISAVLDDEDLLGEILLRVAFPTSLVRAALVCRRWLRLASAPAFLRRFRHLHPPSLLGFYVVAAGTEPPKFVPLPQTPELAAVVSRASFDLENWGGGDRFDVDCCNGLLYLSTFQVYPDRPVHTTRVRCPLYPARYTAVLPPVPNTNNIHDDGFTYDEREILPKCGGGGDGMSYFCLAIGSKEQQTVMDVYVLQDDVWAIHSSAVAEIPKIGLLLACTLLGDSKIYNVTRVNNSHKLILLDLVSSSLSLVSFPVEEVKPWSYELSLTDDSVLHLIHVKGSQLRIWLHEVDGNGVSNWFLRSAICLREICANSVISTCIFKDGTTRRDSSVKVLAVGTNSEFVFLEMDDALYLFDIKRKVAKKVYEITPEDKTLASVIPFMMVWPPKFPVMMERRDPK